MSNVKRWDYDYSSHGFAEKSDGDLILHSDHGRIVTRLQLEKAKLFVRCLELMAESRVLAIEGGNIKTFKRPGEVWDRTMARLDGEHRRLYRLARYVSAKYLGEVSHG